MTDEEKMLWMFKKVHGEDTGSCQAEIFIDEDYPHDLLGVNLMKDECICWTKLKVDIVFDYLTMHLDT